MCPTFLHRSSAFIVKVWGVHWQMLQSSPSYREDFISNISIWQVSVSGATQECRVGLLSEQNKEGAQPWERLQSGARQLWTSFKANLTYMCVYWSCRARERVSRCTVEGRTVTGSCICVSFPAAFPLSLVLSVVCVSPRQPRVFSLSRLLFSSVVSDLISFFSLLSSCNVPLVSSSSHTGFLSASFITLTLTLYNLCVTPLCSSSSYLIFHDTRHASEWSVKNMNFHSRIQTKLFRILFHKNPS